MRDTLEPAGPSAHPALVRATTSRPPRSSCTARAPTYLYVGGGDGRLYEIDVASADPQGTKKSVQLETSSQIGAPSLDGPNNLVLVGSATGVVYAVRVPLP